MIGFDVINLDLWIRSKQLLQRLKNTAKNIITVQEFMLLPFLIFSIALEISNQNWYYQPVISVTGCNIFVDDYEDYQFFSL